MGYDTILNRLLRVEAGATSQSKETTVEDASFH